MAIIGIKDAIYAPISSYTPGSAPTYGTGKKFASAVMVNVTYDRRDNPFYAEDVIEDYDRGISGGTTAFEGNDLEDTDLPGLLGEIEHQTTPTSGDPVTDYYLVGDKPIPEVGFGYIRVKRKKGVLSYEGVVHLREQFALDSLDATTKKQSIEWGTTKLTGKLMGVEVDNSGIEMFIAHKTFTTYAAAQAFTHGMLNYTPPT